MSITHMGARLAGLARNEGATASATSEVDPSEAFARWLASGGKPSPVAAAIALMEGEQCFGKAPVLLEQWLDGDDSYVHKSGGFLAGGLLTTITVGSTLGVARAIGNQRRRRAAQKASQARFRLIDRGDLYVTNRRLAVAGSEWTDIWFPDIRMSDCTPDGITLNLPGMPAMRLHTPNDRYWFLMFRNLAYGERPS